MASEKKILNDYNKSKVDKIAVYNKLFKNDFFNVQLIPLNSLYLFKDLNWKMNN